MSGVVAAQAMLLLRDRFPQRWMTGVCGVAAFGAGVAAHLALDAVPHNNWTLAQNWFPGVAYAWLANAAVVATPFLIFGLVIERRHWVILLLGVLGGLYPDIEKLGYIDFNLPQAFVLFPSHSLKVSSHDGGWSLWECVLVEASILISLLGVAVALARRPVHFLGADLSATGAAGNPSARKSSAAAVK
ncbi:MAG: hypothetical protein PCFJNLEI_02488 [Verrucomicrobiae bacterium]|nr:hypothetical protein [Verrucomicrobiae bacterium]